MDLENQKRVKEFAEEYGEIMPEDDLVLTDKGNFYPLLRRKIIQSWQRVFTMPPKNKQDEVATVWEIRCEWIRDERIYR